MGVCRLCGFVSSFRHLQSCNLPGEASCCRFSSSLHSRRWVVRRDWMILAHVLQLWPAPSSACMLAFPSNVVECWGGVHIFNTF